MRSVPALLVYLRKGLLQSLSSSLPLQCDDNCDYDCHDDDDYIIVIVVITMIMLMMHLMDGCWFVRMMIEMNVCDDDGSGIDDE